MIHQPKYALFYDNHTMKAIPDVGANFDVEAFTDSVKRCGVDYIVFHARCNQGLTYYDTKIGVKHPSLPYDLFGKLAVTCQQKGIALAAYFNAGISSEEGLQYREWTTLYFDGRSLREPRFTPHVRTMCYNSGYRDHLIAMVKEVVSNYPIAGLMIDCLISYPCVCPLCVKKMKEKGIDWSDLNAVTCFSEDSAIRLAGDIAVEARKINPNLLISNYYPDYEKLKDTVTEIAIVYPKTIQNLRNDTGLQSAVRMLSELKQQFDVVTLPADWSKYRVLIFPDNVLFSDEIAERVKAHIDAGKFVISTGISGLNIQRTGFALEKEWGIKYLGDNDFDPAYFTVGEKYSQGLPDMALSLYSSGIDVQPLVGYDVVSVNSRGGDVACNVSTTTGRHFFVDMTLVEAWMVKPYQNRGWDGDYAIFYNPPQEVTGKPALTLNGKVAHFSHRIFSGYYEKASVELRQLFSNVLDKIHPDPVVKTENLPAFARVFVTEQPNRRMVHLLSYLPEMRGRTPMIEEGIDLLDVKIRLRDENKSINRVYAAPDKNDLSFKNINGYTEVTVPRTKGYSLLVFEN